MKNTINIAYVLTPVEFGGAEKVSLNFLRNIDRSGFNIRPIVLVRPWEENNTVVEEIEKENFQCFKIPVALKPPSAGRDYLRVMRCYRILFSFLREDDFQIVHTNGYFADIIGIPLSKLLRIPSISTCHGFISNDRNLRIYNKLDVLGLRFANEIIAVSEEIREELIKAGISKGRVIVIQNAVDWNMSDRIFLENRRKTRKLYDIGGEEILIGYVGRLSEEKGLRYLIEAVSELKKFGLEVRIVIIGEGPGRSEIERWVMERGISNSVIFAGFQRDIKKWLPSIDIFVLPSLTEGTPIALLEAMAAGLPVVASAVGGIPEVVNSGKNGILIPPANPGELVNALLTVSKNDRLRKSLSKVAKETIRKRFGVEKWITKIENTYTELLSGDYQ